MKDLFKKVKKAFGAETSEISKGQVDKNTGKDSSFISGRSARKNEWEEIPEPATIRAIRESAYMPGGSKPVNEPIVEQANKKSVKESVLPPASQKRDEILRFIIHGLRPYTNEKNTGIKGIQLFVRCHNREEENLVNVALYADRPKAFQQEVLERKLSDNYLTPDPQWNFEFSVIRFELPDCQINQDGFGMNILKDATVTGKFTPARITILTGQTEKTTYLLDPSVKLKCKIGRGFSQALPSGMMHTNDIVFLGKEDTGFNESIAAANLTVSRYHAMIIYNPQVNRYYIAADTGGTPDSGNKTKLFTEDGKMTRLDIAGALHILSDGDQVELGGSARLVFESNLKIDKNRGM